MRRLTFLRFCTFGLSTVLFKRTDPILGTIILTDACNLQCRHCSVNNIDCVMHPYDRICDEMRQLYDNGIRILFFCGGETFMWEDGDKRLRDLVIEARRIGYPVVNVVTNGTFSLDLPEADLILLSLDGDQEHHDLIRGDTYQKILENIDRASASNICLYMAINQVNRGCIRSVCDVALEKENVRAVSFNFHTPYPGTHDLALTRQQKAECCTQITELMDEGYPIFNLRSAFPYIIDNTFPTPCHQCVVMEDGRLTVCGRCIDVPGLCDQCGYFFAAEYALMFSGNFKVVSEMFHTYLKYV